MEHIHLSHPHRLTRMDRLLPLLQSAVPYLQTLLLPAVFCGLLTLRFLPTVLAGSPLAVACVCAGTVVHRRIGNAASRRDMLLHRAAPWCLLLGAVAGYLRQEEGLRYLAAAAITLSSGVILRETAFARSAAFAPLTTAAALFATGAASVASQVMTAASLARFGLELAMSAAAAYGYTAFFGELYPAEGAIEGWQLRRNTTSPVGKLSVAASLVLTLRDIAPVFSIRIGVLLALLWMLTAAAHGAAQGALTGLLVGILAGQNLLWGTIYGLSGTFCGLFARKGAFLQALAFVSAHAALLRSMPADPTGVLLEAFAASVIFLTFSPQLRRLYPMPRRTGLSREPPATPAGKLSASVSAVHGKPGGHGLPGLPALTEALRVLQETASPPEDGSPEVDALPEAVRQAAEEVCQSCAIRKQCWQKGDTDSLLRKAAPEIFARGSALPQDFPPHFAARCLRFSSLLESIDRSLDVTRIRQRYRRRAREDALLLTRSYGGMARAVQEMARAPGKKDAPRFRVTVGSASKASPRHGKESVCGDAAECLRLSDGRLYLLLSDGCGTGPEAAAQSKAMLKLLRSLLKAGLSPETALTLTGPAFTLRCQGESFASVDILRVDPVTGVLDFFKCGAAPSYLWIPGESPHLRRVVSHALPAGMHAPGCSEADHTGVTLHGEAYVVLLSDGVTDAEEDAWLAALLKRPPADPLSDTIRREGGRFRRPGAASSAGALAAAILEEAVRRGGEDDRTVLVARIAPC